MGDRLRTYERLWELMEGRQWDSFSSLFSEDVEMFFGDVRLQGREETLAYFQGVMMSFPDIKHEITSVIETEDSLAAEVIAVATCAMPLPVGDSTLDVEGRHAQFEAADLLWFRGQEVIRWNAYFNESAFRRGLGITLIATLS
jgi:hypothetical protein